MKAAERRQMVAHGVSRGARSAIQRSLAPEGRQTCARTLLWGSCSIRDGSLPPL